MRQECCHLSAGASLRRKCNALPCHKKSHEALRPLQCFNDGDHHATRDRQPSLARSRVSICQMAAHGRQPADARQHSLQAKMSQLWNGAGVVTFFQVMLVRGRGQLQEHSRRRRWSAAGGGAAVGCTRESLE